jgi:hypothetical protein
MVKHIRNVDLHKPGMTLGVLWPTELLSGSVQAMYHMSHNGCVWLVTAGGRRLACFKQRVSGGLYTA